MALFRVLDRSFIGNSLREPGEIVEIAPDVMTPGPNLEAVQGDPLDTDGDGEVSVVELRAALDAKGITYDKRWRASKLKALLDEAG